MEEIKIIKLSDLQNLLPEWKENLYAINITLRKYKPDSIQEKHWFLPSIERGGWLETNYGYGYHSTASMIKKIEKYHKYGIDKFLVGNRSIHLNIIID